MRPLYLVLKAFLRERGLDATRTGGVCSFMLVSMLVYFLQTKYKEGSDNVPLHMLLFGFFEFYAV